MKIELEQAFETLGVPVGAPVSDIRSAYRSLILAHHPDHVAGDTAAATQRLAEINAAKDLIDRSPRPRPQIVADPAPKMAEPTPPTADETRMQREAAAREFRKTMEARAQAEFEAGGIVHSAAEHTGRASTRAPMRPTTSYDGDEDARRQRQAKFEAMMSGKAPNTSASLLGRLRTLTAR